MSPSPRRRHRCARPATISASAGASEIIYDRDQRDHPDTRSYIISAVLVMIPGNSKWVRLVRHKYPYYYTSLYTQFAAVNFTEDETLIRNLVKDHLGPKFEEKKCVCACGCLSSCFYTSDDCIKYISAAEAGDEEVVTMVLELVHERSMCSSCYHQHRWGMPSTSEFVEHMKKALRNLDVWSGFAPFPQRQPSSTSQIFGTVLEGEPLRYRSLTLAGYLRLLSIGQTEEGGLQLCKVGGCRKKFDHLSTLRSVNELRRAILKGDTSIDKCISIVRFNLYCYRCGELDGTFRIKTAKWIDLLSNPEWAKFHTEVPTPHRVVEAQSNKFDTAKEKALQSKNLEMLAELRARLLQTEDMTFVDGFLKLADELRPSLGCIGGGTGAPDYKSDGGTTGAPVEY